MVTSKTIFPMKNWEIINYSFNFKKNLVFGYINNDFSNKELQNKNLFIEVEKNKYPVELIDKPLKQTNFKNS